MFATQVINKWTQSSTARQVFASISCLISAMIASICFYWMSPYTVKLTSEENQILTPYEVTSLISTVEIGSVVFSIPAGILADRFGRKSNLLFTGIVAAAVWLITMFTKDIVVLYIVRVVQGACLANIEIVAPVYIAEISGARRRGTLGGYYSVFYNLGMLYAFIISDNLSFDMYTLSLLFLPLLFCISYIFIPESPYYYFMKNEPDKAKSSLKWLRYGEDIEVEFKQIEEAVQEDMKNMCNWKDLIATKKDRRALFIVLIVGLSKYLVGVSAFLAYAEDIFAKVGQQVLTPNQQSICLALLFTLSSFISSFFSDIAGRRKLLIYSLIGTLISNIIIAVYFYLLELTSLQITPYVWIMYVGALSYCISTTIGLGQLMPTVKTEFFPSHTRSKGGVIMNLFVALCIYMQMFTFPLITIYIGIYFNFILFGIVAGFGCIFVTLYVPESAGKTLAEVNQSVIEISSR